MHQGQNDQGPDAQQQDKRGVEHNNGSVDGTASHGNVLQAPR